MALLLQEIQRRSSRRKLWTYYPDEGPLRRELYPKHLAFFEAGATYRERLLLAANRVGKTEGVGGYEVALHLTGEYPAWWKGRRFKRGTRWWAVGDTSQTVRDIIQYKLLGPPGQMGTGLIPGAAILNTSAKAGVAGAIDTVTVHHVSGVDSHLTFKSYAEGRESFQGTELDGVWMDEEPDLSVWSECATRLMTTNGLMICTFTPLNGLSETVLQFLPNGQLPTEQGRCYVLNMDWDDAPHLTAEQKQELWDTIPPYQREARSKGIPALGSGAIYPVAESDITVEDFEIPEHFARVYGLDVGWNRTAGVWLAWDRDKDVVYAYSEHYQGNAEPVVHAHGIKGRGEWIPGVIDPAANGRTQTDGTRLMDVYRDLGLDLQKAENSVEAGIYAVWQRLSAGKLKIFKSCRNLLGEMRLYRRDEKGKVVKENDHACDALRYAIVSGLGRACTKPVDEEIYESAAEGGWMGR